MIMWKSLLIHFYKSIYTPSKAPVVSVVQGKMCYNFSGFVNYLTKCFFPSIVSFFNCFLLSGSRTDSFSWCHSNFWPDTLSVFRIWAVGWRTSYEWFYNQGSSLLLFLCYLLRLLQFNVLYVVCIPLHVSIKFRSLALYECP